MIEKKDILDLGIDERQILLDEPMSAHTTFRIGGPADMFVTVLNRCELAALLSFLSEGETKHMLIGNGSNLLFSDEGYRGVVIRLGGEFEKIAIEGNVLIAGGAATLAAGSKSACDRGLSGLEFASGIPGTIGGAVFMNAGAYGGEIKDVLRSAVLMSPDGSSIKTIDAEELELSYRHSILPESGDIVVSATFELSFGDREAIAETMRELLEKRNSKQPLNYPSAGSTFKRPVGGYAAQLIEEAGLKGARVGGAEVSTKHSGFVINVGGATCEDVLELMYIVQRKVYEDSGILLEPEIRVVE